LRTLEEIQWKIDGLLLDFEDGPLSPATEVNALVIRLPWEMAKKFIGELSSEGDWIELPRDYSTLREETLAYLPTFEKALKENNLGRIAEGRGFLAAWTWLMTTGK